MDKSDSFVTLPNLITLANLFCGCLGVAWAFEGQLEWSVYMIWVCAILDVLDGLVARGLGVSSNLGKQLDSMADLVSFGLLPSAILYVICLEYLPYPWPFITFLVVVFSSLRLARFNLDSEQATNFRGLPTPASAILISSFPSIIHQNSDFLRLGLEKPIFWLLLIGILSYLLISNIRLLGFKFQNYGWSENKYRYILIGLGVVLIATLGILAIPWILLAYIVISVIWQVSS